MSAPAGAGATAQSGPPYLPPVAILGGQPTPSIDDPICGVLLVFFIAAAVFNMTVLQINLRRDHKFILSGLTFGFCMARIVTLIMRIVWASRPTNVRIGIASTIFNAAGVLLLFIINLIFTQRLVRAYHPHFGWHKATTMVFRFFFFSVIALLIMVITATVLSFYTLDRNRLDICRKIQLFAGTYLAVLAFLPIPIVLTAWAWPRKTKIDKFGEGRFRTKVLLVLFTATLLSFGAGFRIGGSYDARPKTAPGWFHHRAAYYCVNFVIELIVVYTYSLMRFDKRFHIPNGSSAPGHYTNGVPGSNTTFADHINTEAEAFGGSDEDTAVIEAGNERAARRWDSRAVADLEKQDQGDPIRS
ncbi:hypothetical protein jhhlp_007719 [Lomentospora prolificans]|uniref:G-protein coupled receptors family 3 profile domain-containing protein n=1 Tax=Lomentospora prolificans TaxID=41688 RepID=A0A2N3N0C8_9PEZI|nr:hypothetical protein jhhlp_007719 [Lomentospora prolificans]